MKRLTSAFVGVFLASCLIAPAAQAMDSPPDLKAIGLPGGGQVSQDVIDNQNDLFKFAEWIATVEGDGTNSKSGFIGLVNSPETRSTKILWNRGSAKSADHLLAEAKARGINATVESRKNSRRNMQQAADMIISDPSNYVAKGYVVDRIKGLQDGVDGIEVVIKPANPELAPLFSFLSPTEKHLVSGEKSAVEAKNDLEERATGLPSTVKATVLEGEGTVAAGYDRAYDSPRFFGGSWMSSGGGSCTSGFAINYNGVGRTTTARHCVTGPYKSPKSGYSFGSTLTTSHAGLSRVLSGTGRGSIIVGDWWGPYNYQRRVTRYQDLSVGDIVNTNGANSGTNWGLKVRSLDVMWDDKLGGGAAHTIEAVQQNAGIAAIQGDSGGPVFTSYTSETVGAAGMIQAVAHPTYTGTTCGDVRNNVAQCSDIVLFTSMRTMVNNIPGASLATE